MAGNRSFKDYVANCFEDELYDRAKTYILSNRFSPEFTTKKIDRPDNTEVDCIHVVGIEINNMPKGQVEFIVTVVMRI